jgi:hypothetical protein
MPTPISSTSPSTCDPTISSCAEAPPAADDWPAPGPATVNVEPVVITGDAGAQALLRRYDASDACGAQKQGVFLAAAAIITNAAESGPASAFLASVICGGQLRGLSDCHEDAQALQSSAKQVIDDCHDRGGKVSAGGAQNEIICEVTP